MRKKLSYLLVSIQVLALLVFSFNMLLSFRNLKFEGELPISDIQNIQEQNDKIYIGLAAYKRIQVYDLNGKYLNYIQTSTFAKDFDFVIDKDGKARIHTTYKRAGFPKKFLQINGDRYLKVSQFPLKINKIDKNGEHAMIQQPMHMSFWGGTYAPWLIGGICSVLFMLINSAIILEVFGSNLSQNEKLKVCLRRIF